MFVDCPRWAFLLLLLGSVLMYSFEAVPVVVDPLPTQCSTSRVKFKQRYKRLKKSPHRVQPTAQTQARLGFNLLCIFAAILMIGSMVLSIFGAFSYLGLSWLLLFLSNMLINLFCGIGLMTLFVFPGAQFWRALLFFSSLWGAAKLLTWGFLLGIPGLWITGLMLAVLFIFSIIGLATVSSNPPIASD